MGNDSILDKYLNEIGNTQLLTDEEEQQLALRIDAGDDKAIDRLVGANLRYVVTIARQYERQGLSNEDLISEGNMGLMKAAARFSSSAKKRFVVFAAPYIRQAIEQAISRVDKDLQAKEKPTNGKSAGCRSLDESLPRGSRNNYTLLNVLEDTTSPHADAATELVLSDDMQQAVRRLDERQQEVISRYFGIDCERQTMAEIGREMGLKRERVRQIRDQALRKLRK